MNKKDKNINKRQQNKANNRSLIINAGIKVFLEKGISNATVRDIIRKTSLASGTFYNYFKSKEEVLIAALDESAIEIGQELRSQRKDAKNLEEFIYSQINPFFEFARDHSELFMIMSSNLNDVKAFSVETPMMTLEIESLKEDIIIGINNGILPDVDPDYFCSVIQSVSEGIAFTFVKGKMSNEDINNAVKFCTNFIVNGIRAV
mgnify:FL=1|tara:strand:- start:2631 stop:3242 length:612 start_codon:yes stop_codon:yes gene_type:complete